MSRKEYKKVYHGIPKSITDVHSIFYASFDSTIKPDIGVLKKCNYVNPKIIPSLSGHGMKNDDYSIKYCYNGTFVQVYDEITLDVLVDISYITTFDDSGGEQYGAYLRLGEITRIRFLSWKDNKNKLAIRFYNSNGTSIETINITLNSNFNHFRLTYNSTGIIRIYINGNKKLEYTKINDLKIDTIFIYQLQAVISDLHISNIDRGDYFPNLPQDFIDGKAIIKPRMGQQQIKGDPMYSQVTTLKVDTDPHDNMYKGGVDSSGFQRHTYKPELSLTSSHFENGQSIKIKALNNEIISGTLDEDTALAHVIKYVGGAKAGQNYVVLKLNDVSKLEIEDTVRLYYNKEQPGDKLSSLIYKVSEIDRELNEVKLIGDGTYSSDVSLNIFSGGLIVETTASSSTPIVKTKEGDKVEGTWTGLGTNEVIFRLGNNKDLRGKDLYIEYSLIIPSGNSEFTDLPQNIDCISNQNSTKLKETNKLTIEDDFMGKTKQYGDNCSSTVHFIPSNSIVDPRTTLNSSNEISIGEYSNISLLNMNEYINRKSTKDHKLLQLICKFNLIDMVENKFSTELPGNKLEWLKSHITKFSFYVIGKGNTTIYLSPYNVNESKWFGTDSKYNGTNFSPILYVHSSGNKPSEDQINKSIDSKGNVYFRIYTDAVTASTEFSIDIAYIKLEIELKYDTTFNLYFSENRRAREDKCVPMLVQKETKTIKSYLDIKEPIVTEYVYNKFKGVSPSVVPSFEEFEYSNNIQINSMGTGRAITVNNVNYKASIAYLTKRDTCNYTAEPVCKTAYEMYTDYTTEHYASGTKYISRTNTYANRSYGILVDGRDVDANNFTTIFPFLINYNGSLHLGTITDFFINRKQSGQEIYYFPLPNSPLLKK